VHQTEAGGTILTSISRIIEHCRASLTRSLQETKGCVRMNRIVQNWRKSKKSTEPKSIFKDGHPIRLSLGNSPFSKEYQQRIFKGHTYLKIK